MLRIRESEQHCERIFGVACMESGRAFGYQQLFRSMLEVTIWLSLSAVLGAIHGVARLTCCLRVA